MAETYNGYTNYETWLANLHISNTESFYNMMLLKVKHYKAYYENIEDATINFARWIEEQIERTTELISTKRTYKVGRGCCIVDRLFVQDLYTHAINKINYYEIAKIYMEDN